MAGLKASAAAGTVPDVQVEAAQDGPARDLGLELLGLPVFAGRPAAVGADRRQRHVEDFVGGAPRDLAVSLGAVVGAALSPRRGRRILGRPLGEWGGLPFAGPQDFLELRGQLAHLGLQFGHPLPQALVLAQ